MNSIGATSAVSQSQVLQTELPVRALPGRDGIKLPDNIKSEFSALVLKQFLEAALPENLLGSSGAGSSVWRSMLADQLAKSIADSGQVEVL